MKILPFTKYLDNESSKEEVIEQGKEKQLNKDIIDL